MRPTGFITLELSMSKGRRLRMAIMLVALLVLSGASFKGDEKVYFNLENSKYHCLTCKWAIKCTKNCIEMDLAEAKRRGGIPCKVCGGTCH